MEMKRVALLVFLLVACLQLCHAQRFKSIVSHIRFFSDAPLEDVEAINESVSSMIDATQKTMVIMVPIADFEFKKKLMQEHFNENYLESDKYPSAIFKGKIQGWDGSDGTFEPVAVGTLEMHGVVQEVEIKGQLTKKEDEVTLSTVFDIRIEDYKIKVPKAVFYKIAEVVQVTAKITYSPYEKN